MTLFMKLDVTEDDSLSVRKMDRRRDEECPEASAPPPFAQSVPLPLHQNYNLDQHRNHSRKNKIKSNKTAPSESSGSQRKEQNDCRNGACYHLAYTIFLFCIVWPFAFITANLWIATKPLGSVSIYLDKIPCAFERCTKKLTDLLVGHNSEENG